MANDPATRISTEHGKCRIFSESLVVMAWMLRPAFATSSMKDKPMSEAQTIELQVCRYDPDTDSKPSMQKIQMESSAR